MEEDNIGASFLVVAGTACPVAQDDKSARVRHLNRRMTDDHRERDVSRSAVSAEVLVSRYR